MTVHRGLLGLLTLALSLGGLRIAWAETSAHGGPRWERQVTVTEVGPQSLAVDLVLLGASSPTLADLRLLDDADREVPYLVIPPQAREPSWLTAASIRGTVNPSKESGFEADFGKLVRLDLVRIDGLSTPWMKRLRIEASGDRKHYNLLVSDATLFDLPEEGLKQLKLDVAPGEYRYLRFTWDDKSSSPVGLPATVAVRLAEPRSLPPALREPIEFEMRPTRGSFSQWRLRLPGRSLPIASIEILTKQPQLLRQARVSETRLVDGRLESRVLGAATLRRTQREGLVAADLQIPLAPPEEHELLLTVDNGDNLPLVIDQIQVELLPQPSLYFEAKRTGSFRLRYGQKDAAAPRYDLEAERGSLAQAVLGKATFVGRPTALVPSTSPGSADAPSESWSRGSALDPTRFAYSRTILGDSVALVSVHLDAAVLAHSSNLSDLRVVDAQSQQVPYWIEQESEPLVVDLATSPMENGTKLLGLDARTALYHVRLPYRGLPAGRLVLRTNKRVFRRAVALYVQRDHRPPEPPTFEKVSDTTWIQGDPRQEPTVLELPLPERTVDSLLLAIEDGDNERLPIVSCRLLLGAHSLRFFRKPGDVLMLTYGSQGMSAPNYDLTLLTEELKELPTRELGLGPEIARVPAPVQSRHLAQWFWGILVLTVLSLVAFISRLVAKGGPQAPDDRQGS